MGKKSKKGIDISYTVYTEEIFDICYPEASEEEKDNFFMLSDQDKLENLEKSTNTTFNKIRRVVLDQEYIDWINENDLPNNEESRCLYANQTSNQKAEELWVKNMMDKDYIPLLLPVTFHGTKRSIPINEISLPDELSIKTREYIANMYQVNSNDVWIHPILTRADVWDEEEGYKLYEFACDYFNGEKTAYSHPRTLVSQKDTNLDMRFIPICICYRTKANTTYKKLKKEMEPLFLTDRAERLSKLFTNTFPYSNMDVSVLPYTTLPESALEVRQEFLDVLTENAKNNDVKIIMK